VDQELSPLVQRTFALLPGPLTSNPDLNNSQEPSEDETVLNVIYSAATNRMLRVSVNGFFESLRLVVQVMEDLDVDVVMEPGKEELVAVQGLGEVAVGV
jgi:EKC/KEOPS complex subunit PCC1/LAGE3